MLLDRCRDVDAGGRVYGFSEVFFGREEHFGTGKCTSPPGKEASRGAPVDDPGLLPSDRVATVVAVPRGAQACVLEQRRMRETRRLQVLLAEGALC